MTTPEGPSYFFAHCQRRSTAVWVGQAVAPELLDRLWERSDLSEDEASALAVEAQHRTRSRR